MYPVQNSLLVFKQVYELVLLSVAVLNLSIERKKLSVNTARYSNQWSSIVISYTNIRFVMEKNSRAKDKRENLKH